ncbi:pantoate--beta-alanine ligase [Desulforamulus aquiferis]|uniref:Pantothenate synthetase n=1 Tax=Desulforamulus aquiferis TaxID=1397668 RepID=A0AAW7ZIB3_9FIRM|nr:pantoate--beta-alanine ligase [Desulforamulus aquiferis]MDO7788966.1 pantoate--beta-alanine ligase [Desulforamulus aquiferis]
MRLCKTINEIGALIKSLRIENKTVGLVPTMGYLHEGHLTLVREARQCCDVVVMSIFVNPTQFGPKEDFGSYPRDLQRDSELAEEAGVDIIFAPEVEEMYPRGFRTSVDVEEITDVLCGAARPGHFRGVATVVTKLFNIVQPDMAFFGQKDYQQVLVIKGLVRDLNINVKIIDVPIARELDGLALSSRNVYLSKSEREAAKVLSRSLAKAQEQVANGVRDIEKIRELVLSEIESEPLARIDYVEIRSIPDLKDLKVLEDRALLALAVKFGNTRLIDNKVLEV